MSFLEQLSIILTVATPIILLIWFFYTQRQILLKEYLNKNCGIYAGFIDPINKPEDGQHIYGGIIMNILDVDNKGYFKGELDFAETESISERKLRDGIHTFYGKLNFKVYRDKIRHPFKTQQNRIYNGKLYIVDRLDFSLAYKIEDYITAEYDVIHYREMQILNFKLSKILREESLHQLPNSFTLYKRIGLNFEPYINLVDVVFQGETRVDK